MSAKKTKPIPTRRRYWTKSELPHCEEDYRNGDRLALAHAIAICARLSIPLPDWAAAAYVAGYRNLLNYHIADWESIFGPATPPGRQLSALRKRHQKSFKVWLKIQGQHEQGTPIDDELFETVGKELGLGATLVKEYYKEEKQAMERTKRRLEEDDADFRIWYKLQLDAAKGAISAGRGEEARALIEAIEKRYEDHYGVKQLPS